MTSENVKNDFKEPSDLRNGARSERESINNVTVDNTPRVATALDSSEDVTPMQVDSKRQSILGKPKVKASVDPRSSSKRDRHDS